MTLDHVVFTRFSYRNAFAHLGVFETFDALDPAYLHVRRTLLEMIALPCILSQTNQQFAWVIIVDPNLPDAWRESIERIAALRPRSHVVEFEGPDRVRETSWIAGLLHPGTDFLITTILDDDDSLPTTYLDRLRARVEQSLHAGCAAPAMILAARQIVQWELTLSAAAPLGYRCPWHRPGTHAAASGFSLGCKFPELPWSVLGLKHAVAFNYLAFWEPPAHPRVREFRSALVGATGRAALEIETRPDRPAHTDLSAQVGPVLMSNHTLNNQAARLLERKSAYEIVTGPETFENFAIDWSKIEEYKQANAERPWRRGSSHRAARKPI